MNKEDKEDDILESWDQVDGDEVHAFKKLFCQCSDFALKGILQSSG